MKTAVSVPDDVFQKADALARSTGKSRSEVYSTALREYVARHEHDAVTETLNRVVRDVGAAPTDDFVAAAARRTLESTDW